MMSRVLVAAGLFHVGIGHTNDQGGDYQQYMKKYAGGSQGGSQSQGGDYQQYMKKYAGGGQSEGTATELLETADTKGSDDNAKANRNEKMKNKYVDQFVPAEYRKYALKDKDDSSKANSDDSLTHKDDSSKVNSDDSLTHKDD